MATVLVALMAFAVQSCGSDDKDDLSSSPYEITGAVNIQQKGELADTDIATLKEKFAQSVTGTYMTDQMAESTTDKVAQGYIASLKEIADILGHVRLNTTSIYAKVNLTSLRGVAEMNWEGLE